MMHAVLHGPKGIFVYLYDILMVRLSQDEHVRHSHDLFAPLQQKRLIFHSKNVSSVDPSRISLITRLIHLAYDLFPPASMLSANFPTSHQPQYFLILINFHHHFLSQTATLLHSLHCLCWAGSPSLLNPGVGQDFNCIPLCLGTAFICWALTLLVTDYPLRITSDASDVGAGTAL